MCLCHTILQTKNVFSYVQKCTWRQVFIVQIVLVEIFSDVCCISCTIFNTKTEILKHPLKYWQKCESLCTHHRYDHKNEIFLPGNLFLVIWMLCPVIHRYNINTVYQGYRESLPENLGRKIHFILCVGCTYNLYETVNNNFGVQCFMSFYSV